MGDLERGVVAWLLVSIAIFLVITPIVLVLILGAIVIGWPAWVIVYICAFAASVVVGRVLVSR